MLEQLFCHAKATFEQAVHLGIVLQEIHSTILIFIQTVPVFRCNTPRINQKFITDTSTVLWNYTSWFPSYDAFKRSKALRVKNKLLVEKMLKEIFHGSFNAFEPRFKLAQEGTSVSKVVEHMSRNSGAIGLSPDRYFAIFTCYSLSNES